ncbi:histidine kinase [Muricauda sp. 2012CJ35-5]|uniref:Histidine kinase n=1 Tax=Flagellimonas spongiicola TaxID=2942208 RepID=A0ABT0PW19_9FLAO|nr:histidine kinase [Allomuricauda spongiicola]MCL6275588.1 histidine kinase [Allomuricauda spongiicola]
MNKKLFLILVVFFFFSNLVKTIANALMKYYGVFMVNESWGTLIKDSFVVEMAFNLLLIVSLMFISNWMFAKSYRWSTSIFVHLFFYLVTLLLVYWFYDIYLVSINAERRQNTFDYHIINIAAYMGSHFLQYFATVFIIYTYHYLNKIAAIELNRSNLREQLVNVKVNILKYKLHPHFFFNTLNTITNLIETNTQLAQKTLVDFSGLLRDILYLKDSNLLTIEEEYTILKKYLDILSVRFSDDLEINIDLDNSLNKALIPSLILQPIVENAIKHGYSLDHPTLQLDIKIAIEKDQIKCTVVNNGKPLSGTPVTYGTGLQNTLDRLTTLYYDNFTLSINNISGNKGVITTIGVPLIYQDTPNAND